MVQSKERQETRTQLLPLEEMIEIWELSKKFREEATKMIIKHKIHSSLEYTLQFKDSRRYKRVEKENKETDKRRIDRNIEDLERTKSITIENKKDYRRERIGRGIISRTNSY